MSRTYRATAYNRKGFTFQFTFNHVSWNEIEMDAQIIMDCIVSKDQMHRLYAPWACRDIEVTL